MVKTIALDVKGGCEAYTAPKGNTVGALLGFALRPLGRKFVLDQIKGFKFLLYELY